VVTEIEPTTSGLLDQLGQPLRCWLAGVEQYTRFNIIVNSQDIDNIIERVRPAKEQGNLPLSWEYRRRNVKTAQVTKHFIWNNKLDYNKPQPN